MVTGTGLRIGEDNLREVASSVSRELTTTIFDRGEAYIQTPMLYPDGTNVLVRLNMTNGNDYFVTDCGLGARTAHLSGADYWFRKYGEIHARMAGIHFDAQDFFTVNVAREKLAMAVATLANASKTTVDIALLKMSEHRQAENKKLLESKLVSIFGSKHVTLEAEVTGASNHRWMIDVLVDHNNRRTAFDLVKPVPQSVYPAVAKFVDISDADIKLGRVAVLESRPPEMDLVTLLSRSAKVIFRSDPDEIYQAAA
ncbi:MAG: hypothetical protein RIB57_15890 [Pelagibacterium sp.]|uniref:hypothetical protein n=1 Tax=Pelagibacterium sp. TaxID=1967288 RepID=UPI0032F079C6